MASMTQDPVYLEARIDKFILRVARDRAYTAEGVWARPEADGTMRLGVSDYLQQSSGDVTFATVRPAGTHLAAGDPFVTFETIKIVTELGSPVAGTIVEVNPELDLSPARINQAPYGAGWLARLVVDPTAPGVPPLLEPPAYFELMKRRAEEEIGG
jgi:glycine cleavage system H protein